MYSIQLKIFQLLHISISLAANRPDIEVERAIRFEFARTSIGFLLSFLSFICYEVTYYYYYLAVAADAAPPWALALHAQLINQIANQTNQIANQTNQIANQANEIAILRSDVAICFNMSSAISDNAAIRQPIVAGAHLPFQFPRTRWAFLNLTNAEYNALLLYYDMEPIPGGTLANVNMKRAAIAHHIGLRL
jgi:hypothetical protein